jgi:sugar/nucleoside kinase (ribokinase family)
VNVVCVGDCGIDHYLPSGERRFGGITANVARHARKQFPVEDEIHLVSCVGDDEGAELVLSSLAGTEINCHIQRLSGSTPVQFIEIDETGEKNFVRYNEGVLRDFSFGSGVRKMIAESDLLIAPVYLQIVDLYSDLMSISTAGLTAIDFADFLQHPDFELLERYVDNIDIAFFGLRSADGDTIAAVRDLAVKRDKLFIVTLGADGSRAFTAGGSFDCPVVAGGKVVDTTGAGDAYAAAFLSRYCHGDDIVDSMNHGAKVAADVIGKLGSWS